jgi:tripeptidyl-peptidase-1
MKLTIAAFVLGAGAVSAAPRHWTRQHQTFESVANVRPGWTYVSKPHPDQIIDLSIALKETGNIYDHLNEVADPDHERYGQHVRHQTTLLTRRNS